MSDLITLACPSCGAQLQITQDLERFACSHCGHQHIVRRSGGVVSLAPVLDQLAQVRAGVDRTASELAIPRLEKELAELSNQRTAFATESELLVQSTTKARHTASANTIKALAVAAIAGMCTIPSFISLFGSQESVYKLMCVASTGIAFTGLLLALRFLASSRAAARRLPTIVADTESKLAELDTRITKTAHDLAEHRRAVSP